MSNSLVVTAITTTLRKVILDAIQPIVPGFDVITVPLDKVRDANPNNGNVVNLYLYHTMVNAGWSNLDPPNHVKSGEKGFPPLALNLFYLVTAYGQNNNEVISNGLLVSAMSILHDTPVLDPADLRAAIPLPNTPGEQIERIRVTHEPLSLEEISKLWAAFQTNYRLSAAYQVTVVLIDSIRASKAALPVLRRGQDNQGVTTMTSFPAIDSLSVLEQRTGIVPMALPGNTLIIRGSNFQSSNMTIRLSHPRFTAPVELAPAQILSVSEEEIRVRFPTTPTAAWPAGYYSLGVVIKQPGSNNILFTSNEMPFALLPQITAMPAGSIARVGGNATLNISFSPQVWADQRVALLLGDREIQAPAHPNLVGSLAFVATQATAGQFYLRLRVDGVDSLLLDPASPLPQFDNTKRVTIT